METLIHRGFYNVKDEEYLSGQLDVRHVLVKIHATIEEFAKKRILEMVMYASAHLALAEKRAIKYVQKFTFKLNSYGINLKNPS